MTRIRLVISEEFEYELVSEDFEYDLVEKVLSPPPIMIHIKTGRMECRALCVPKHPIGVPAHPKGVGSWYRALSITKGLEISGRPPGILELEASSSLCLEDLEKIGDSVAWLERNDSKLTVSTVQILDRFHPKIAI